MDLGSLVGTPVLGLSLRVGESALDREVGWVVTTDLLDPRRYLSGGELVLTGMMWRHDETDAETFVRHLVEAGAVALGAGDPALDDLPTDLVDACERHGLPLFHVGREVSFSTITEHVVRRLAAGRSGDLAAVLGRHRSLIEAGTRLSGVLALVTDELGMSCWVLSGTGRLVEGTSALGDEARAAIAAEVARGGPLPRRVTHRGTDGYSVFGVGAPPHVSRLLVVDDDHTRWSRERRAVADELVAMVALDHDTWLREHRTDDDLFTLLDDDADAGTVATRLRAAGLDPGARLVVAFAHGDPAAAALAEVVEPVARHYAWAGYGDAAAAVAELTAGAGGVARDAVAVLAPALAAAGMRVSVGVSDPVTSVDGLAGAWAEAKQAREVAALDPAAASLAGSERLASHVLLLADVSAEVRQAFRSRVLDPLLAYDERHTSDLVHTLETFLDSGGSWSQCAAELHVHVNTLRYRIDRIERLTGRDLRRLPDQVDLYLALRLR